jgi:hypothetical protein
MPGKFHDLHGVRVFECSADGPILSNSQEVSAITEEALSHAASLIIIPVGRFAPAFFQLRNGLAGEVFQKFSNYRLKLAVIGDLSVLTENSTAFRDLIYESNRGNSVWFLSDIGEVEKRLAVIAAL